MQQDRHSGLACGDDSWHRSVAAEADRQFRIEARDDAARLKQTEGKAGERARPTHQAVARDTTGADALDQHFR